MTTTNRDLLARTMTESQLQRSVIEMARTFGWRIHHCRPGMDRKGRWATPIQGDAGFVDLILLRGGRAMAVELKSERGRLTWQQEEWLAAFRETGCETYVWQPRNWLAGECEAVLK
mgnify:CR=1 FL=1